MRFSRQISTIITSIILITCSSPQEREWVDLFNGLNLEKWDTYLGPAYDTIQHKWDSLSPGPNHDTLNVFGIALEEGTQVMRISGQRFGGISTKDEFENYHLQLEFKWGELKWAPNQNRKRDSGLLYHAVGPHGADNGFWMRSQEFQIQEGDCGDYWGVAGGVFDVTAAQNENGQYVYDPQGSLVTFSEKSDAGRRCIKNPDGENPTGKWNVIDLYCLGDTAVHVVNGIVNMVLLNSRQLEGGSEQRLSKGKIQLQSEGAEIFFRKIRIQPITQIPPNILGVED